LKKKKPKKGEEVPEVNEAEYKMLTTEILIKMLQARLSEEDCNAGVIFDNLQGDQWPDIKTALEFICDAIPEQNIQIMMFQF
jgi:adenylate kinase family enzyme